VKTWTNPRVGLICNVLTAAALSLAVVTEPQAEERVLEPGKWYPTVEAGVTLTQSAFSDNWAGGDKGSIVWTGIFNAGVENQLQEEINWSNILKLAYGQTHQQSVDENGRRFWQRPEKSTDLIDFETVLRFTLRGPVDPYASGRFQSQFQDASDPFGRTLSLNPMQFKESAGIARKFINEEERSLLSRLGFTFRQSRRSLFEMETGDATVSKTTNDGGVEWVTDYKSKILNDRVSWTSKLSAYQPVFYSEKDQFDDLTDAQFAAAGVDPDVGDFAMTVDVDWENILTTQITKLISVNLYIRWVYDKYDNSVPPQLTDTGDLANAGDVKAAIRKAGQLKQTLALGFTYRLL
jgi:hypothetical protein